MAFLLLWIVCTLQVPPEGYVALYNVSYGFLSVLLLSCLSLLPPAPAPSASSDQPTSLLEWAGDLVASPHFAAADRDAAVHAWLDRVLAERAGASTAAENAVHEQPANTH